MKLVFNINVTCRARHTSTTNCGYFVYTRFLDRLHKRNSIGGFNRDCLSLACRYIQFQSYLHYAQTDANDDSEVSGRSEIGLLQNCAQTSLAAVRCFVI